MKECILGVSEFKTKCLRLLDEVQRHGNHLVITKYGRPIARVTPVSDSVRTLRGSWKGVVNGDRDIVHVDFSSEWEANG
jgi:prevent-host-death family protein